jgi:hypothetical protein
MKSNTKKDKLIFFILFLVFSLFDLNFFIGKFLFIVQLKI